MSSVPQESVLAPVLMWISWGSPRPTTRSCTWIQLIPTVNTHWRMESSSAGKDLGILVDEKLATNQQYVLAAQKASWAAWQPSGQGRQFSNSALPRCHLEYCVRLWAPPIQSGSRGQAQKLSEGWNTSPVKTMWEMELFSMENAAERPYYGLLIYKKDLKERWRQSFYQGLERQDKGQQF